MKLETMKFSGAWASVADDSFNIAILLAAIISKIMNGVGTLATIWATVVLLGGFAVLIKQQDFWYVTIVAFVESIGYVVCPSFCKYRSAISITNLGWQEAAG
jgi:hypothetical protein